MYKGVSLVCGDGKFRRSAAELLEKMLGGWCDAPSFAGGVKDLLDPYQRYSVVRQLEIFIKAHNPSVIVLLAHKDCAAYGGSSQFPDSKHEEEFHRSQLQSAAAILRGKYPEMKIILGYMASPDAFSLWETIEPSRSKVLSS